MTTGPGDWHAEYPGYLLGDSATLLDPAPALNALTVGSLARHERNERWPNDPAYRPIARTDQPSPFTRRGPSVNRAIKPDLVDYGGNMIVNVRAGGRPAAGRQGVGELSTSHDFAAGRPFSEDSGTSFAAPRVANAAANLLSELPDASVDLCRALLVAHARTPGPCVDLFAGDDEIVREVTGYGLVDRSALYRSLEDCVTLWAEESIENRRHHFYEIPMSCGFLGGWQASARADRSARIPSQRANHPNRLPCFSNQLQVRPRETRSTKSPGGSTLPLKRTPRRRSRNAIQPQHSGNGSIARDRPGFHVEIHATLEGDAREFLVRRGDPERPAMGPEPLGRTGVLRTDRHRRRPTRATAPALYPNRSATPCTRPGTGQGDALIGRARSRRRTTCA